MKFSIIVAYEANDEAEWLHVTREGVVIGLVCLPLTAGRNSSKERRDVIAGMFLTSLTAAAAAKLRDDRAAAQKETTP